MNLYTQKLQRAIEPLRRQIIEHPLYAEINQLSDLRVFMRIHVFAVWDFMSLLKALQKNLTCVETPWFPIGDPEIRFLINEIVAGEESDMDANGKRTSHFELYLAAMQQTGAATSEIENLLNEVRGGSDVFGAINASNVPQAAKNFMNFTFELIADDQLHKLAAVFTFGREDLIPEMFLSLVADLESRFPDKISILKYYLHRHIEVDGGEHSHLALAMTEKLCGTDQNKWREATVAVERALSLRIELWNGTFEMLKKSNFVACI